MFGRQRSILDHLDYRHLPSSASSNAPRWLDRVTLDGIYPGNLLEFYRRVIPKLRDGLQIPFKMGPDLLRRDDIPQHEALCEATVNTLIHADYPGRGGIRIFRLPHGFEFNNPGLLRLPAEQIRSGGKSGCRNFSLQQMFQMIGAGEKAGSGFPKILQAWREQDWRAPTLEENTEQEEVCLRLTTISFFPPEVTAEMERLFPQKMHLLNENGRLAWVTAILEGSVTNGRLQDLTYRHPRDLTFLLTNLVKKGFWRPKKKDGGVPIPWLRRRFMRGAAAYPIRLLAYPIKTVAPNIRGLRPTVHYLLLSRRSGASNTADRAKCTDVSHQYHLNVPHPLEQRY